MNNLPIHYSLKLIDGDITVWLDPPPPLVTLCHYFTWPPSPPRPVTYFMNGPLNNFVIIQFCSHAFTFTLASHLHTSRTLKGKRMQQTIWIKHLFATALRPFKLEVSKSQKQKANISCLLLWKVSNIESRWKMYFCMKKPCARTHLCKENYHRSWTLPTL